jgi:putative transposase
MEIALACHHMAFRKVSLVTGHIYHVFNRGVEKRTIFTVTNEYAKFLRAINYYLDSEATLPFSHVHPDDIKILDEIKQSLVDIVCFCLMPNHFHLILKQNVDRGISWFMQRLQNSYSTYFNTKYERVGPLFQGPFKAVLVNDDSQLLHLSRYIHLNPVVAKISPSPIYQWSSLKEYLGQSSTHLCQSDIVLHQLGDASYLDFVNNYTDYALELERIKHLTID